MLQTENEATVQKNKEKSQFTTGKRSWKTNASVLRDYPKHNPFP